jgi:uncharacterized membrane protein YqiK
MESAIQVALVASGALVVACAILGISLARRMRRPAPGTALVVHGSRGRPHVFFDGSTIVFPLQRATVLDITRKQIEVRRYGKEGIHCRDGIRVDVGATFSVRVNNTREDVLDVLRTVGERAGDLETLRELFEAKFSEGMKIAFGRVEFEDIVTRRMEVRDQILEVIGKHHDGFVVEDLSLDYLELTPIATLDRNNIIDARGMKKLSDMTVEARARIGIDLATRTWSAALERENVRDVRVAVTVACDVASGQELRGDLADLDVRGALVGRLAPGVMDKVGSAQLECTNGHAVVTWNDPDVTAEQLVAGAKVVLALRTQPGGYR